MKGSSHLSTPPPHLHLPSMFSSPPGYQRFLRERAWPHEHTSMFASLTVPRSVNTTKGTWHTEGVQKNKNKIKEFADWFIHLRTHHQAPSHRHK